MRSRMGIHILILGTHLNSLSPERRRIIVFKLMRKVGITPYLRACQARPRATVKQL
jgi:hypothetical protein